MTNEDDLRLGPELPEPLEEEPEVMPIEGIRPLSYSERRKSAPIAWKPFLLWLVLGLALFWSFAFLLVWLGVYAFGGVVVLGGGVGALFFVRMYLRMNSDRPPLPRRRRFRKERDDPPLPADWE